MGQVYFELKDYQSAENNFILSQNIYHQLNKSQQEDRLRTIVGLVTLKTNSSGIKESSPLSENSKDSIIKNIRNSGSGTAKHKIGEGSESKGIDLLGQDNLSKIQNLSEEDIRAKIKRDSLELERLKKDHALNDINLTHEEDSIKDAKRELQIEALEGKISSANQALLQKQLQLSKIVQQRIWFLGGAAIVLLLVFLMYNRYRLKKKAFTELELAHEDR